MPPPVDEAVVEGAFAIRGEVVRVRFLRRPEARLLVVDSHQRRLEKQIILPAVPIVGPRQLSYDGQGGRSATTYRVYTPG